MGYEPISGQIIQYQKEDGGFASNFYLKFYKAGTNTPLLVTQNKTATDQFGLPFRTERFRLNTSGIPVNGSGSAVIPHVDQPYKMALFRTAEDADDNATGRAVFVVDGIAPGLVGFSENDSLVSSEDVSYIADGSATERTVAERLRDMPSVMDYGATGNGSTDDTNAFATALLNNSELYVPSGDYLVGGVIVQQDYQNIHFGGLVTLRSNANDVTLFKQASSSCHHTGRLDFNANGFTGVNGFQCGPIDLDEDTVSKDQIGNIMPEIQGSPGIGNLVTIQCGPEISGNPSSNARNRWPKINSGGSVRAVWFKPGVAANGFIPNSHIFEQVMAIGGATNAVIHIEAGRDNDFIVTQADFVTSGSTPLSIATGVRVENTDTNTGQSNDYNRFHGGYVTNTSRSLDNDNKNTVIIALDFESSSPLYRKTPIFVSGSEWKSSTPTVSGYGSRDGFDSRRIRYIYSGENISFNATLRVAPLGLLDVDGYFEDDIDITTPFNVHSQHVGIENSFPVSVAFKGTVPGDTRMSFYGYFTNSNSILIPGVPRDIALNQDPLITFGTLTMKRA